MTETTIYATTDDHYNCRDATYPVARACEYEGVSSTNLNVGQRKVAANDWYTWQPTWSFDTSGIPAGETVTAATLSLWGLADNSTTDFVVNFAVMPAILTPTTDDYIAGDDLSGCELLASWDTTEFTGSYGSPFDCVVEDAMVDAINKSGYTWMNVSSSRQRTGDAPDADAEYSNPYSTWYDGTLTYQLVVTTDAGTYTLYATPRGSIVVYGESANYATARSTATATFNQTNQLFAVGQTNAYRCYQTVMCFNTWMIPDSATVTDVALSFYTSGENTVQDFVHEIRAQPTTPTGTSVYEYVHGEELQYLTPIASLDTSAFLSAQYNNISIGASYLPLLDPSGTTWILGWSDHQEDGTEPSGDEYVQFEDLGYTGTSRDPKLVITSSIPTTYMAPKLFGVW